MNEIFTDISDIEINQKLSEIVNNSFISLNTQEIVEFINNILPELDIAKEYKFLFNKDNISKTLDEKNAKFPVSSIEAKNKTTDIKVFKDGHIQIAEKAQDLFISREDLKELGMDDEASFIIGNGIRGLDPYDQKNWTKTSVGTEWPTSLDTRDPIGVVNLFVDKDDRSIMFTSSKNVGQNYCTNPRGMVIPDKNSVIIIFQQENNNPDIAFAAWSIMPFKVPEKKKAVAFFSYNEKENYECLKNSPQYKRKEDFIILDSSEKGGMAEHISKNTDTVLFAVEGLSDAYLMRSIYKEKESINDKFKIFSLGGSDCKYIELEFIAPQIQRGEKSTLAYKIEPISLSALGIEPFSFENIENESIKLFRQINLVS